MRLLFSSFAYRHVASCKLDWQRLRRTDVPRRVVIGSINMPAAYAINSIPTHPPRDTAALRGKDNRSTTLHVDETRVRSHTYTVNTSGKTAGLHVYVCVFEARTCAPRPRRKLPSTTHFLKYLLPLENQSTVLPQRTRRRLTRLFVGGSIENRRDAVFRYHHLSKLIVPQFDCDL